MPIETFIPDEEAPNRDNYRPTLQANYLRGSFIINDDDTHSFRSRAVGKGRLTICVDIGASTSVMTVSVYGMHDDTANIGETGVVQIGSDWSVTAAEDIDYETVNDPFPFYLIRCVSAALDAANSTCMVYGNYSAF